MTTTTTTSKKPGRPRKVKVDTQIKELPRNPLAFEVLDLASKQRSVSKKIEVLQKYQDLSLKMLFIWNFYEELINIFNIELSKPFDNQMFTPTQILNDYIKKKLNEDLKITPHELGIELNNSLILWGIEKAKFFNDKST